MKLISMFLPLLFSIASTKFHLDRERRVLYEFSVEKFVLLSFGGYVGVIDSKKKNLQFFIYFFLHVQCGVRVSASYFQVLQRKSGGAGAFGNNVRFLAGPARTGTVYQV